LLTATIKNRAILILWDTGRTTWHWSESRELNRNKKKQFFGFVHSVPVLVITK